MSQSEKYPERNMKIDIKSSEITFHSKKYRANIQISSRSALLEGTWDSMASLLESKEAIITKTGEFPYFNGFVIKKILHN